MFCNDFLDARSILKEVHERTTGFSYTSQIKINEEVRGVEKQILIGEIEVDLILSDTLDTSTTLELSFPSEMKGLKFLENRYQSGKIKRYMMLPEHEAVDITNDLFYAKYSFSSNTIESIINSCINSILIQNGEDETLTIQSKCNNIELNDSIKKREVKYSYRNKTINYINEYNEENNIIRKISFLEYIHQDLKLFPIKLKIEDFRKKSKIKIQLNQFKFINR